MNSDYNKKRINPPFWQHDYHVLKRIAFFLVYLLKKYTKKEKSPKIMLDYGCGSTPYKEMLSDYYDEYIGVDIGQNKNAQILVKENEKILQKSRSIDILLSTQVLEHVKNVSFYLSECKRLLKKDGILLLSTHGVWPYHKSPEDYHRWTKEGLEEDLKKAGFEILEACPILGRFAAGFQFNSLLFANYLQNKTILGRITLALISVRRNIIIWLLDKIFPAGKSGDSSVYIICAKNC